MATLLNINVHNEYKQNIVELFSGNQILRGVDMPYISFAYAGFQFGDYNPDLGDGRAISIGQLPDTCNKLWDIQLKGSGPTPYSRGFDGRSVLRSAIREYIGSEAMHHLGIPTTRALCIIGTKTPVERTRVENGAILVRVAQSHLRFGTFELFHYRKQFDVVRSIADFVIQHHYPNEGQFKYKNMFEQILRNTATLIAKWMAIGFVHGVMNTDNMSIIGLTLDYGPYGFMDRYNPDWCPNRTDTENRYAYKRQPEVGLWNLKRLATALSSLPEMRDVGNLLDEYDIIYREHYLDLMRNKLGLVTRQSGDEQLVNSLLHVMAMGKGMDYTNTFRSLKNVLLGNDFRVIKKLVHGNDKEILRNLEEWMELYKIRLSSEGSLQDQEFRSELEHRLDKYNPKYIPRTYILQNATQEAEEGDYEEIEVLLKLYSDPYSEDLHLDKYASEPPINLRTVISCSS
jgi:hypothetical protein